MASWEQKTLAESGIVKEIGEQAAAAGEKVTELATQVAKVAEGAKLILGGYADIIGAAIKAGAQPLLNSLNDYRNMGFYTLIVNPFELNKPDDQPYGFQMKTKKNGAVVFKTSTISKFDPREFPVRTGQTFEVGDTYALSLNLADLSSTYKDRNGNSKSHPKFVPPIPELVTPYKLVRGGYDPTTWTGTAPEVTHPGLPKLTAKDALQVMADAFDDKGDVPKFQMINPLADANTANGGPFTEDGTPVDNFDPTANLAFHLYASSNTSLSLSERVRLTKQIQAGKPNYAGSDLSVSCLVVLAAADDPQDFINTLKKMYEFFGSGGDNPFGGFIAAYHSFIDMITPDDVIVTVENNTKYGTFQEGDYIIGETSGAVGLIKEITGGEKSIRLRTISEVKTDKITGEISSIFSRDVDMNPDGDWKTYKIQYEPKFDLTEKFEPNEKIFEAEPYDRIAAAGGAKSTYYRRKGEDITFAGPKTQIPETELPKYGKVMGLSALAPNSVAPDFNSITASQFIPGWSDFFDGLIELANGLINLAQSSVEFLNRLILAIEDLTAYLITVLAKIKAFLKFLEDGLPNVGIYLLPIKTNGGNESLKSAITGSTSGPPDSYKFSMGMMLLSVPVGGIDPLEKFVNLLGIELQNVD